MSFWLILLIIKLYSRKDIFKNKTVNLGVGRDRAENVVWLVNDITLPKFVSTVDIHCGTNNMDTINSDELNLSIVAIASSISQRYPNIEVIVCGLLTKTFSLVYSKSKNREHRCLSERPLQQIHKNDFHEPRPRLDFAGQLFKHKAIL